MRSCSTAKLLASLAAVVVGLAAVACGVNDEVTPGSGLSQVAIWAMGADAAKLPELVKALRAP